MKVDFTNEEIEYLRGVLSNRDFNLTIECSILNKLPRAYSIGDKFKLCNWSDEASGTVFTLCLVERPDKVALVDSLECYGEGAVKVTDPRSITDDDIRNITGNRVHYFKKIGEE